MKYELGIEGEYQPGSNEKVLANKLGITDAEDMFDAESTLLRQLYEHIFQHSPVLEAVNFETITFWHRAWLSPIYSWAGSLRTADMSKGGFRFAAANFLHKQIPDFEERFLSQFASLVDYNVDELVAFLARLHVEFILIHPFREGNGRISRLLNDVLLVRAGYLPMDYQLWHKHRDYYIKAIQAGVAGDYQYIERLMRDSLKSQL